MKIKDLLELEIQAGGDWNDLFGCYYSHIPEVERHSINYELADKCNISVGYFKYKDFDDRRIWALGKVMLDNVPFMIIQNAGREGDDWSERYIFNEEVYNKAVSVLRSCYEKEENYDLASVDDELKGLVEFYGCTGIIVDGQLVFNDEAEV